MKRLLFGLVALVAALALVLPASAADFKFGGYIDTKWYHTDNISTGDDDEDDNVNGFKTRLRLYFTAIGSENVKAVTKVEMDDTWGNSNLGTLSADGGSSGEATGFEIKNAYIDFQVPDVPVNMKVGIIPPRLGYSGLTFNDDTSGVEVNATFEPVRVRLVYSRLGSSFTIGPSPSATTTNSHDDTDLWGFDVRYSEEMWDGSFAFAWINGPSGTAGLVPSLVTAGADTGDNFDLYIFTVDLNLRMDIFTGYLTAAINAGKDDGARPAGPGTSKGQDFKGYLVTLGGSAALDDNISVGLDFYWASGDDDPEDGDQGNFVTPGGLGVPSRNMSEIAFPGWFDDVDPLANLSGEVPVTTNWTATGWGANGGYVPTNVLAIGGHVDLKPLDATFVQLGGAWMKFVEDVDSDGPGLTSSDLDEDKLGFEVYGRLQQGITDGLALKVTAGYLFLDDGYASTDSNDDAWQLSSGLFWSW